MSREEEEEEKERNPVKRFTEFGPLGGYTESDEPDGSKSHRGQFYG